jgi:hypothetical protein
MGPTRQPDRLPGSVFPCSLGFLVACSVGHYTERCRIKREMKAP